MVAGDFVGGGKDGGNVPKHPAQKRARSRTSRLVIWSTELSWDEERLLTLSSMSPQLTARQREVLALVIAGMSNKDIAADLGVSLQTVKWHVSRLFGAYGVDSRISLVREVLLPTGRPVHIALGQRR